MIHQFAINMRRQRLIRHSHDQMKNHSLFWVEAFQSTTYRHESHACNHSIIILASVVNAMITQKMWIIVLCDSMGEKIVVIVTPKANDHLSEIASILKRVNSYEAVILSVINPSIVVETFPLSSDDSLKMLLVASEDQIQIIDMITIVSSIHQSLVHEERTFIEEDTEMKSFMERYWNLTNPLYQDVPFIPIPYEISYESSYPYHIRDILMHEIYPRQRIPLSCVLGIIIDIQLLLSTSSLSKNLINQKKKLKIEYCDKLMLTLRDTTFGDTIVVYLPVTSSTISFCTIGMMISLLNPYLKCSLNQKNVYLECKNNEFSIGESPLYLFIFFSLTSLVLCHYSSLPELKSLSLNLSSKSLVSNNQHSSSFPLIDIVNLYSFAYRNRCFWKIRGTISFIREIQIYPRCLFCYQPLNTSGSVHENKPCRQCHHCSRTISITKENIWWRCVSVIDDGTSEANICFEGSYAILFLQSCYQDHVTCVPDLRVRRISFSEIKQLIELLIQKHLIHLDSQHLSSMSSTHQLDPISSSSHYFTRSICLCQRYHQLLLTSPETNHNSSSSSSYQHDSTELLYLLDNFMSHCSFSSCYELTVKLIHSSKQSTSITSPQSAVENPIFRYPKKKKKIPIQKFNDPFWLIENIEYMSEVHESLRLHCHGLKVVDNEDISEIAWKVLRHLE
jgi:hypothetical protein